MDAASPYAHFDRLPCAVCVTRDVVVVYANEAALALLGRERAKVVGRPFMENFGPEDAAFIHDRHLRRVQGEPVPAQYEMNLVGEGGLPRRVELSISMEGDESTLLLRDVTESLGRRELLLKIAQVGAGLPSQRTAEAVWEEVFCGLEQLDVPYVLLRPEGAGLRVDEASHAAVARPLLDDADASLVGVHGIWTPLVRRAWAEGSAYSDDSPLDLSLFFGDTLGAHARAVTHRAGLARGISVRIDRSGEPYGLLTVCAGWLHPDDLAAFRLFGAQISAALDAARAISRLSRRNASLTAINLLATAAATVDDPKRLFEIGAREITALLASRAVAVFRISPGKPVSEPEYLHGTLAERILPFARLALMDPFLAELVGEGMPRLIQRAVAMPALAEAMREADCHSCVIIPLVVRSSVIGTLLVTFDEHWDLGMEDLDLLQAMGAHLAAAVESHGLLAELRGRVRELTLLNDVSMRLSPTDPRKQISQALERILSTVEADAGSAYLREGAELVQVVRQGFRLGDAEATTRLPGDEPFFHGRRPEARLIEENGIPESVRVHLAGEGIRAWAVAPLLGDDEAMGWLFICRRAARPFSEGELALLGGIGAQLGIAVKSSLLVREAQRRAEEVTLIHEVGRSLAATLDLKEVLEAGVANLLRIVDVTHASVFLINPERTALTVHTVAGDSPNLRGRVVSLAEDALTARAFHGCAPVLIDDARTDDRVSQKLRGLTGGIAYSALPLMARGQAIGVVLIIDRRGPRTFAPAELERISAITNQLAVAVENARLYEDLRKSYAELARTQAQLVNRERLAALGELSAVVAHEVRNPLGAIFNSLASIRRLVAPLSPAAELVAIVGEEADRLNRIVGDLLEFARPATLAVLPTPIAQMLDESLAVAVASPRARRVQVVREVEADLPLVPLDERMMRQALLNIALNAVQAMPDGGTLRVRASRENERVRIQLADTGAGIPPEVRPRIFEPFFTTKATGTGLGLAIVKRIIDWHFGQMEVTSSPGQGTTFSIFLPLAEESVMPTAGAPGLLGGASRRGP